MAKGYYLLYPKKPRSNKITLLVSDVTPTEKKFPNVAFAEGKYFNKKEAQRRANMMDRQISKTIRR